MKSISHQEDNIIDELDMIEKGLDKYLEIVSKRLPQDYADNNFLYENTLELDKKIKNLQNEINNVQKTLIDDSEKNIGQVNNHNTQDVIMDKNTFISYENFPNNEIIDFDVFYFFLSSFIFICILTD